MPSKAAEQQYAQVLFDSIHNGSYPESEDAVSADLPSTAIPHVLELLKQAREDVKADIRDNSKQSAQDIDGWILQAKQLRSDIEDSHTASKQIGEEAVVGDRLRAEIRDASAKVDLLKEEVLFTETLVAIYERIDRIRQSLDAIQESILRDESSRAIEGLVVAENELESLTASPNTRITSLLRTKLSRLREDVTARMLEYWRSLVYFDLATATFNIKHQLQRSAITLDTVVEALHKLGVLENVILSFCKEIERNVLRPCVQLKSKGGLPIVTVDENRLCIAGSSGDRSIDSVFSRLREIIEYLHQNLPALMLSKVTRLLSPLYISTIEATWLSSVVPADVEGLRGFQSTKQSVLQFADTLERYHWSGKASLVNWTKDVPRQWLNKYQEAALNRVRTALAAGFLRLETAERVETQLLSKKEDLFASVDADDSWNAEWSDEDKPAVSEGLDRTKMAQCVDELHGEEDVSAWGLDEDANEDNEKEAEERATEESDDADAWGWGEDDNDGGHTASLKPSQGTVASTDPPKSNGIHERAHSTEREVTLKETYTITSLPKAILSTVVQTLSDAETLTNLRYDGLPMSSSSTGLFTLPRLILTMYRAGAPPCYSAHPSGNMFLYNDSLWLAERLQECVSQSSHASTKLQSDISALMLFGKRAYGMEMESQRTILSDLLDGAQGFKNCTMAPFAQECDLAISSVIDRLREIYQQWQAVLSHSALLQSVGSLLSTAISKIIVDIEDMSDISEPESQRLTAFCNRLAALEDLFLPQQATEAAKSGQATIPLTAVYTPGWLRFQYLAQILESSLVDIKYLWEEGELGLEFEVDEVAELIEALFADSEHRRRAIADIRRAAGD